MGKTAPKRILICGGAGFIGSHFVDLIASNRDVVVLDALTYAGNLENLSQARAKHKIQFVKGALEDRDLLKNLLLQYRFDEIVNFAAETHVDRSIKEPNHFITANIVAVYTLLDVIKENRKSLPTDFRYVQVSTDEVFGALGESGEFTEKSPYAPRSPYSASKAAADMLCKAWFHTFNLPVIVTHCSNNYGSRQYPEKLIPTVISCAISNESIPVYGKGLNVRDWIHVSDHCRGVRLALEKGKPGESYCFGGDNELRNIDLVRQICEILDLVRPKSSGSYNSQISFVEDRAGHDFRYAIDDFKAQKELGFQRETKFSEGLQETIAWYLSNQGFLQRKTA